MECRHGQLARQCEICELESRVRELKRDAERYRWLRQYGDTGAVYIPASRPHHNTLILAIGDKLDAAIDAAIEEGRK